jgi:hypothetical protein
VLRDPGLYRNSDTRGKPVTHQVAEVIVFLPFGGRGPQCVRYHRHSRESGGPERERSGPWIPAFEPVKELS